MSNTATNAWHWSDVTQAELVGRIFPYAAKADASLEGMVPGCYWEPWKIPKDSTELDKTIKKLIEECQSYRPDLKQILLERGIFCPYYAWRFHVVHAANIATDTYKYISYNRRNNLVSEIEAWNSRIKLSRILSSIDPEYALPYGSIHLNPIDSGEISHLDLYEERKSMISALKTEISRDEVTVSRLKEEVKRLNRLLDGKTGKQALDHWKTPFFIYIANLWKIFTGKEVPYNSSKNDLDLTRILQEATRVISGGENIILSWSSTKTLRDITFTQEKYGPGFRLSEGGDFNLDDEVSILARGQGMVDINNIRINLRPSRQFISRLAFGAIFLRDYNSGDLALIVRDTLLRRGMTENGILSPELALQLGWLKEAEGADIRSALRRAVKRARQGDLAAACVVEVACSFDDERATVEALGWTEIGGGYRVRDFIADLEKRDEETPDHRFQSADHKAFRVAMEFIELAQRANFTIGRHAVAGRFDSPFDGHVTIQVSFGAFGYDAHTCT